MLRGGLIVPRRGQEGMASFVVVSVLAVLVTLISLGFARLMTRAVIDSHNRQAASTATYAAQSGINDVATFIKTNPLAKSDNCTGPNSLIGSSANPGPFYDDANLSKSTDPNNDRSTQYTCLLLNQFPSDLVYQKLPINKSRVIKMTTSAFPGALDRMMVSWQATDSQAVNYPPSSTPFYDETFWNDNARKYLPVLRVSLYPIPEGGSLANVQANSKTVFLYPQTGAGTVPELNYSAITDGSVMPVRCTNTVGAGAFIGTADYSCNLIINSLSTSTLPSRIDYFYVRIMPIYAQADVKIKANDIWGQALNFVHVQAVVDITAKAENVAKRLQARLAIGSVGTGAPDSNIAPTDDSVPEFSVRSANAICKRLLEFNSYYNYAQVDGPAKICNQLDTTIYTPAPTLSLSITGNNGPDNGRTVDSEADNPNSPQSPVQRGTVFINDGARVNWRSTDSAYNCNASGSWRGDKNPASSWSGSTGTGSQNFSGISDVASYSLQCNGPGGSTPTKTVKAWPPPVTNISGPSSVRAGQSYTISWSSRNTVRCSLSGSWPNTGQTSTSGSQTMTWPVTDNSSTRTYSVICYDPIGRTGNGTRSWTVSPQGSPPTTVLPPLCYANASFSGSTSSDTYITWSSSCPDYDAASPGIANRFIESNIPGAMYGGGYASSYWMGNGSVRITSPGSYYFRIYVWAPPWATQAEAAAYGSTVGDGKANSGRQEKTIYPPLQITGFWTDGVWDHGAEGTCFFPNPRDRNHWANDTWRCRYNKTRLAGEDLGCGWAGGGGQHRWTTCGVHWTHTGGAGTINCTASVIGYGDFDSSSLPGPGDQRHDSGPWGWTNYWLVTGYLRLHCSDSAGQQDNASA